VTVPSCYPCPFETQDVADLDAFGDALVQAMRAGQVRLFRVGNTYHVTAGAMPPSLLGVKRDAAFEEQVRAREALYAKWKQGGKAR
jgi:hypothetical protein